MFRLNEIGEVIRSKGEEGGMIPVLETNCLLSVYNRKALGGSQA